MTLVPSSLLHHWIAGRPWRVPTDRLIELVEIEIEPASVLQIGHDLRSARVLRDTFPEASVEVREPEHVGNGTYDLVVCAFGLSQGFHDDQALASGLVDRLAPGGVLAMLELVGSGSVEVDGMLQCHGVRPRALLVQELMQTLRALHHGDGQSWMGIWRHVLFLGRKPRSLCRTAGCARVSSGS